MVMGDAAVVWICVGCYAKQPDGKQVQCALLKSRRGDATHEVPARTLPTRLCISICSIFFPTSWLGIAV
uniref:Uncharacterized protein n=1 Tax=Anguilla anguilla TaxID=7936 RepID=A0A0E9TN59_ANGAN